MFNNNNTFATDIQYFMWPDIIYVPFIDVEGRDLFWKYFDRTLTRIVIPIVSIFGIVGNTINIFILCTGQCRKSSTSIVLSLAVADTMYLFGTNNIAIEFYTDGKAYGFRYSETMAECIYYFHLTQLLIEITGKIPSMMLPVVITIDRLVAVAFPFRYPRLMTPTRVRVVTGLVFLFSVFVFILFVMKFSFVYVRSPIDNTTMVGLIGKSSFYINHHDLYKTLSSIPMYLFGPMSVLLTLLGCTSIGILIQLQEQNRVSLLSGTSKNNSSTCGAQIYTYLKNLIYNFKKFLKQQLNLSHEVCRSRSCVKNSKEKLTSQEQDETTKQEVLSTEPNAKRETVSSLNNTTTNAIVFTTEIRDIECRNHRFGRTVPFKADKHKKVRKRQTTKTLLSVCIVYCIANTFNFFVLSYFQDQSMSVGMTVLTEKMRRLILVINSACNFLFYVGLNRKYRERYRKLFSVCFKIKSNVS